jgi:hypothetical protein
VIHAPPAVSHSLLFLFEAEVVVAVAVAVRCRGLLSQLQLQFNGVAWLFDLPTDIDISNADDRRPWLCITAEPIFSWNPKPMKF